MAVLDISVDYLYVTSTQVVGYIKIGSLEYGNHVVAHSIDITLGTPTNAGSAIFGSIPEAAAYYFGVYGQTIIDDLNTTLGTSHTLGTYTINRTQEESRGEAALQAQITAINSRSFANPSRTLNTAFQVSTTRDAIVNYSVDIACTLALLVGQSGTVFLEYADNQTFTTNVKEVSRFVNTNTATLNVSVTLTQAVTGVLGGLIPTGKWVRLRTANNTGTPTFNFRSSQEVLI